MTDAVATSSIEYCIPANWPAPLGHYSPAAAFGDLIYISGQLPDVPQGGSVGFEAQVKSAMQKVFSALASAGGEPKHIIKVTAYVVGVHHWASFNDTYANMMGEHRPARAVVPVPELHHGCLVEIEAVAIRPGRR